MKIEKIIKTMNKKLNFIPDDQIKVYKKLLASQQHFIKRQMFVSNLFQFWHNNRSDFQVIVCQKDITDVVEYDEAHITDAEYILEFLDELSEYIYESGSKYNGTTFISIGQGNGLFTSLTMSKKKLDNIDELVKFSEKLINGAI